MSNSSPSKRRTALASKNVNLRYGINKETKRSPNKKSPAKRTRIGALVALQRSPIKKHETTALPKITDSSFSFYEETPEQRAAVLMKQMSISRQIIHDENDYQTKKENVSPSRLKQRSKLASDGSKRLPLADLRIDEYKGYIEYPGSKFQTPLTLHINHKHVIPSFVTPPRNKMLRDFFTTRVPHNKENSSGCSRSRTTDDIPKDKVVRKLNFTIHNDCI